MGDRSLDPWLLTQLVCPVDKCRLTHDGSLLVSAGGRSYPVVDGIPVMLVPDVPQTIGIAKDSLKIAEAIVAGRSSVDTWYVDTLGVSKEQKAQARLEITGGTYAIDPVVAALVAATNGIAFKRVVNLLPRLPIPHIPDRLGLPRKGAVLDVGCSWGRWSMALGTSRELTVVGLDPSLGAVAAARRLADSLGVRFHGVVGDARFLPFAAGTFGGAFSYSVIQHFSRQDASTAIGELARTLRSNGTVAVQMPNRLGLRCLFHQSKRGFRDESGFEVRYWSRRELLEAFNVVGPTTLMVDCFFGLGLQATDRDLMSILGRYATNISEALKRLPAIDTVGSYFADSLWCVARKECYRLESA